MNKDRRKEIGRAIEIANRLRGEIEELVSIIQTAKDEEEEYKDNMPESLQSSDRYYTAEAAVDALESALSPLEDLDLDEVISQLETASE